MQTINKYIIMLYIFLCPVELALNIIFGSTTKYIGILLFIVWFALIIRNEHDRKTDISHYVISIFLWLAYCVISFLWGVTSSYTTEYLTTYLQMGMLVFICTYTVWKQSDIDLFIHAYFLGSILMALAMIFFGGNEFSGRGTVTILGKFCDSNQVAANIVPGALILYFKLFDKKEKNKKTIIYIASFLFTSYTILLTSSRGGLISLLVGVVLISFIQKKKNLFRFDLILFLICISILLINLVPVSARQRVFNFASYTDEYATGGSRLTLWSYLFEGFDAQWLVGHGVGSTITFFMEKLGYDCGVHNTFVLVLYEVGIMGFAFFIYPYIGMIVFHIRHQNAIPTVLIISAMISSFFLDALNLRYLWNGLIICLMQYDLAQNNYLQDIGLQRYKYIH